MLKRDWAETDLNFISFGFHLGWWARWVDLDRGGGGFGGRSQVGRQRAESVALSALFIQVIWTLGLFFVIIYVGDCAVVPCS
jgi:hypothetical protein